MRMDMVFNLFTMMKIEFIKLKKKMVRMIILSVSFMNMTQVEDLVF